MFTLEDIEEIFERLANMEIRARKHYGDDLTMLANETDADRYKAIERQRDIDATEIGALQFGEGLVMNVMKRRNYWTGSRAEATNFELKELRSKQYAQRYHNE